MFLAMVDDNKVTLIAGVSKDAVKNGVKAGDLLEEIAPLVGGRGGRRPDMPRGGENDPAKPLTAIGHRSPDPTRNCPMGLTGSCTVTRVRARLRGRAVGSSSGS